MADFTSALLLLDYQPGRQLDRRQVEFPSRLIPAKVATLVDLKVDLLICGALSREFAAMVVHSGIELLPFISGSIEDVLAAYNRGDLSDQRFLMPGYQKTMRWCSKGRRRRQGRFGWQRFLPESMATKTEKGGD
ncbi:MAG: hypothetical protein JW920_00570 [Deltaproteobacteria bacterium]|nr:hypothetical protein [Deltaproteobacteria bacterium]